MDLKPISYLLLNKKAKAETAIQLTNLNGGSIKELLFHLKLSNIQDQKMI